MCDVVCLKASGNFWDSLSDLSKCRVFLRQEGVFVVTVPHDCKFLSQVGRNSWNDGILKGGMPKQKIPKSFLCFPIVSLRLH